jgi:tellurite resistance protein
MTEHTTPRLQHFPISWFAVIMGMTGFTIAWHKAETLFALPLAVSSLLLALTLGLFLALLVGYAAKVVRYPQAVEAEFAHPVKLNFFPTLSISLILLSIALLPYHPPLSMVLWSVGTVLHLGFTLYVLSAWLHQTHFEISHINPAWFIPIVGNILCTTWPFS